MSLYYPSSGQGKYKDFVHLILTTPKTYEDHLYARPTGRTKKEHLLQQGHVIFLLDCFPIQTTPLFSRFCLRQCSCKWSSFLLCSLTDLNLTPVQILIKNFLRLWLRGTTTVAVYFTASLQVFFLVRLLDCLE